MPGDVPAQSELLGENGIAFGPLDHVQEAEIRKSRAVVGCDGVHDLLIAAGHEHVGDRLLDRLSLRDRKHMGLALGADVGDQGIGLEFVGLPEYRPGDFDRIVKGELVNDIDRRLVEAGQPPCKLGAGRDLDLIR